MRLSSIRPRLLLTLACLAAALELGAIPVHPLAAQEMPACNNGKCIGPSMCMFSWSNGCEFLGPDACLTKRCAFILET